MGVGRALALAMGLVLAASLPCSAADTHPETSPTVESDVTSEDEAPASDVTLSARQRRKALLRERRETRRDERRESIERLRREKAAPPNQASPTDGRPPAGAATDIKVSFKLDPRLTRGLYMGDRWVSPRTYSGTQEGEFTVETRAQGHDAQGRPVGTTLNWKPADPQIVSVSPGPGNAVTITVHRAGESLLLVTIENERKEIIVSRELPIKAWYRGTAIAAEIDTSRAAVKGAAWQASTPSSVRNGWRVVDETGAQVRQEPSRPVVRNGWRFLE